MIFIDIQYLRGKNNEIIIKELAYIVVNDDGLIISSNTYFFRPPYSSSELSSKSLETNYWSTTHLHRFDWRYGQIEYSELPGILYDITQNTSLFGSIILVKGKEKRDLIEGILKRDVINIECIGCPRAQEIIVPTTVCHFHCELPSLRDFCARALCEKYSQWYLHTKKKRSNMVVE